MRKLLLSTAFILLAACSSEKAETVQTVEVKSTSAKEAMMVATEDSRLVAVLSYADWCSSCKILEPKVETVQASGAVEGVSFLTLDYTDRDVEAIFAAADAAGVGEAVRAHFAQSVTTGIMLLVDRDDKKVVSVVKKEMTNDEIAAAIQAAAAAA